MKSLGLLQLTAGFGERGCVIGGKIAFIDRREKLECHQVGLPCLQSLPHHAVLSTGLGCLLCSLVVPDAWACFLYVCPWGGHRLLIAGGLFWAGWGGGETGSSFLQAGWLGVWVALPGAGHYQRYSLSSETCTVDCQLQAGAFQTLSSLYT